MLEKEYILDGVQVQEVDARFLEKDLVRTAELIDRHQPFVVLLTHYEELLHTQHKLDYPLLSKLFGVPIGLAEDKLQILQEEVDFRHIHVTYGKDVEAAIDQIINVIVYWEALLSNYQCDSNASQYS
jgi:Fe2+ transport system protein B